jgi:hypothetical protein
MTFLDMILVLGWGCILVLGALRARLDEWPHIYDPVIIQSTADASFYPADIPVNQGAIHITGPVGEGLWDFDCQFFVRHWGL